MNGEHGVADVDGETTDDLAKQAGLREGKGLDHSAVTEPSKW